MLDEFVDEIWEDLGKTENDNIRHKCEFFELILKVSERITNIDLPSTYKKKNTNNNINSYFSSITITLLVCVKNN